MATIDYTDQKKLREALRCYRERYGLGSPLVYVSPEGIDSKMDRVEWENSDWKLLPSLRKHEQRDDWGGPLYRRELPRCSHGVYLTLDPIPNFDSDDIDPDASYEVDPSDWLAPYCHVCNATWTLYRSEFRSRFRFIRKRSLEQGESKRLEDKLLDGRKVYPEIFTKVIKLRGRTLTSDLRLQEDPETGKPRLETMGGYVAKEFGYGSAGMGHGPDSDADDIRMSWLAGSEGSQGSDGSPVGHDHEENYSHQGWNATLPSVCPEGLKTRPGTIRQTRLGIFPRFPDWYEHNHTTSKIEPVHSDCAACANSFRGWRGITKENWQPIKLPFLSGPILTNLRTGLGLSEGQFFGDQRTLRGWKNPQIPRVAEDPIPDFTGIDFENWYSPLEWTFFNRHWQARLDLFRGSYDSERRTGHWDCHFDLQSGIGMPTARHFAQWGRKAEYQRGGGVHHLPRRRTPRWSDDWRTERKMRDTSANLNMYRWGVVNRDPDQLPDIAAKVAHRCGDGTTREIQVEEMCATASENYRKARLALATNCGTHQRGHIFEAHGAFYVRYSVIENGIRTQKERRLCESASQGSPAAKAMRQKAHRLCEDFMRTVIGLVPDSKNGYWKHDRLEGNDRGTPLDKNGCAWGGKAPKIVAGNHGHRLGEEANEADSFGTDRLEGLLKDVIFSGVGTSQVKRKKPETDPGVCGKGLASHA